MLSEKEKREIDEKLVEYAEKRAAGPEALAIVQRHRGWISDESLRDIAEYLAISVEELDSVATFYNRIFREQVGAHVILICDSVSCWIMGYTDLLNHLLSRLGIHSLYETSDDGMFTLLPSACLGACDLAPVMMVDDELYGELTPEKIDRILEKHRKLTVRKAALPPLVEGHDGRRDRI